MIDDIGPLSEREIEVLKLVASGMTNQQVARDLSISPNTVKVHLRNIFEKLGVQSRTEATMEAVRRGWIGINGNAPLAADGAEITPAAISDDAAIAPQTSASAPDLPPIAAEPAPYRAPIAPWQRAYMMLVALFILLALLAPDWWHSQSQAAQRTPFSDIGQPLAALAPRLQVSRWIVRPPLPEARSRLAVTTDALRLYAIGGETVNGVSDAVMIYEPRSNSWQAGAAKPTPVSNMAAVWLAGRIYVPGGITATGAPTNLLEVYDPQADAWETGAELPFPLAAYGLAALNGKLYLFGGWDGASYRGDTLIYDPERASWSVGAPLTEPRGFLAASALDGLVYVVGGFDGTQEFTAVSAYDPAGEDTADGPWSARAALSQARGGLGVVSLGARLYAVGGGWVEPLAFNEQYDTRTGAWSRIETPVAGQWRNLGLAVLGQKLYAVGGWSGNYLGSNEEYQALLQQLLPLFTKGE